MLRLSHSAKIDRNSALALLKNGEVSLATKMLSRSGKHGRRVALLLSQAVQANSGILEQLKHVTMTSMKVYGNAADPETAAIFEWVLHGKGDGSWQSKLLAKLLFSPPN